MDTVKFRGACAELQGRAATRDCVGWAEGAVLRCEGAMLRGKVHIAPQSQALQDQGEPTCI
eukprot:3104497-Prymnesium_polylepis.2